MEWFKNIWNSWFKQFKPLSEDEMHRANIEAIIASIYSKVTSTSVRDNIEFTNHEQFYMLNAVYERLLLAKQNEKKELLDKAEDIKNTLADLKDLEHLKDVKPLKDLNP